MDADVIIVGGGPAGLSAALVLGRACRSVLVVDDGRPRNHATRAVHGFLTRDGIGPFELRQLGLEELRRYNTVRVEHAEVTAATRGADGAFRVDLQDGRQFSARRLLLATGVVDLLPAVTGFDEMYGRSVFHCPYCDGWELRGQPLAVYGCQRRGYGLAVELLGWSRDVVLCSDGACELDGDELATLDRNGIRVREERIARLEGADGMLERIVFESGDVLPRRAMFFTTGQVQASRLARQLGCEFNEKGTVRTGPYEMTHVPGLYVAGDASRHVQWVVVAAAEGAEAAYAISQDLIKETLR
ncbi:MAG TPA: NAD(P)/FAD-dependent oxidoreductase [Vicinamibacterales bacterium]